MLYNFIFKYINLFDFWLLYSDVYEVIKVFEININPATKSFFLYSNYNLGDPSNTTLVIYFESKDSVQNGWIDWEQKIVSLLVFFDVSFLFFK